MLNDKLKNYLHLHFIVFIWGFTAVLGALITIDAIPLVWFRMLLASFFVWLYVALNKFTLKVPKKALITMLIAGLVIALHWITFFKAIKVSNVSVTLATISTGAFFTAVLEPIFYKRKMIWYEIVFGLVVIAGLFIIFNVETQYTLGIGLALISALLSATFSLINGKLAKQYRPSVISFYELGSGVGFITLYLLFSGSFSAEFFKLSASDWMYLLLLASICTAYAFIGSVKVMKLISPYTVMLTINMEPVYGIVLAFVILGASEKMSHGFYIGAVIIIMTVVVNGILKNSLKRKRPIGQAK
ncbi:DMT family transporter [Galbibacter pacificus]|uniref:DMT family transporter n=1 Tax=Galbibacter pacificus TaxID=2996052 RepID=A0ABT6FNB2_9FLAO|nr:DMT family transporter [Galbibacter pacificus]MDG3581272.1 DMT family transporter [Galbibacter pacificus]MDG3584750.1 DMT family transporter [Galbibacter pacificus]